MWGFCGLSTSTHRDHREPARMHNIMHNIFNRIYRVVYPIMAKNVFRIPSLTYRNIRKNLPQLLWVSVLVLVVVWIVSVILPALGNFGNFGNFGLMEGMTGNNVPYGCDPKLTCDPDNGCTPPTGVNGNCDDEYYLDTNNHYFRKCYYSCATPFKTLNTNTPCKYDQCCEGVCPPVYFRVPAPPETTHPSLIVHVSGVLHAGVPHPDANDATSTTATTTSTNAKNSKQPKVIHTYGTQMPEYEPVGNQPATNHASVSDTTTTNPSSSSSSSSAQTQGGGGGTAMPEYDPNSNQPATSHASFPDVTKQESAKKNKAFYEGDMRQANPQPSYANEPAPMDSTNQSVPQSFRAPTSYGGSVLASQPAPSDGPKGYTDPIIF